MQYVVMDLEWNNTYARKTSAFINEIIEIGAVKLDSSFNQVDTFTCIIRSQIGHKLRGNVKKLTNLTNEDISSGLPFTKAFSLFRKWIGNDDTVIITWGDGDIRVLIENYSYLNGITAIPFLKNYCDLQKCFQKVTKGNPALQPGLTAAAEQLNIDPEKYNHHRGLDDSLLTADVLRSIYEKNIFMSECHICNDEFYDRLLFKAKVIKSLDSPLVDKKKLEHRCDSCGQLCKRLTEWKFSSQYFKAQFWCSDCDVTYNVKVRFKRKYDGVDFKKVVTTINANDDDDDDE